jgi:hypothetical protein
MNSPGVSVDIASLFLRNSPGVITFDPARQTIVDISGFGLYLMNIGDSPPRHARPPDEYLPIIVNPDELGPHMTDEDRDALRALDELGL